MYIVHHIYDVFGMLANRGKNDSSNHENKDEKWKGMNWVQSQ